MDNTANLAKIAVRDMLVAALVFLGMTVVSTILALIFGVKLTSNVATFGAAIAARNWVSLIWALVFFSEIAGMMILAGIMAPKFGKAMRLPNSDEPEFEMPRKFKIVSFLLFGVVGSVFIFAMISFFGAVAPNVNTTDLRSFVTSVSMTNWWVFPTLLVAYVIYGATFIWLAKHYRNFVESRYLNKLP